MANLFHKQAKFYAATRPGYPIELFQFIASKTPNHQLAWDVGTGSGQAAIPLAAIYEKVVATDTSKEQLSFAAKLPNIRYQHTPPTLSIAGMERDVAAQGSVDVVIVAQAFHWFDQPTFFEQVKWVLRKPGGVLAVWCYTLPRVDESVDAVLDRIYAESRTFWESARQMVDQEYRGFDLPFEPVEGTDHTGPFEFEEKKMMDLGALLTYIRSWSAYNTAKDKGIELLSEQVVEELRCAWGEENDQSPKLVRYPIFLRIGKVG